MPQFLSLFSTPTLAPAKTVRLPPSNNHFAGIDAIRGFAAIAVVLLHACVPYSRPAMAGLSWSVRDDANDFVTVLFWTIEIAIMPIFLVIAGFFAARSMASRDPWSTMTNRLRRLGVPLALAIVLLLPIGFYTWMLGWIAEGNVSVRDVRRMKFDSGVDQNLWGLSHLWFLQYLMTYIIILAASWSLLCRCRSRSLTRYGMSAAFLLAVISLTMRPEVVWGFQHAFLPVLSKWAYSGAFFAAGVIWFRYDPQLSQLAVAGKRLLSPGVLVTVAAVSIGIWWLAAVGPSEDWLNGGWSDESGKLASHRLAGGLPIGGWLVRGAMAVLTVASASLLTFGVIGLATDRIRHLGPRTTSLASASLLIYLLHHPVVGLTHIVAKYSLPGVSPIMKVGLATGLGVAVGWSVSWLIGCHRERVALREMSTELISAEAESTDQATVKRAA